MILRHYFFTLYAFIMNYTDEGYRITPIKEGSSYQWLFFPDGPGLGTEYLIPLCQQLNLPGSIDLIDFPKDGSNPRGTLDMNQWRKGLHSLMQGYSRPIAVTHGFSGMFFLNNLQISTHLAALILMNTTTANSFFHHINTMRERYQLPDLAQEACEYHLNPSDETYKQFWEGYKYYYFTAEEQALGEQMRSSFAFNHQAYQHAIEHFYPHYQAHWPSTLPVMTISSEYDLICPPGVFIENQRLQTPNARHHLIQKAGHCPWLLHLNELQQCLDEFIKHPPIPFNI